LLLIIPNSISANSARLFREKVGFLEAAEYLKNNMDETELYVDDSSTMSLTIQARRGRINFDHLDYPALRTLIRDNGFSEAMKKLNIKYFITNREVPHYYKLVNFFSDDELLEPARRRSDKIISIIDKSYGYFSDHELRDKIIEEQNIPGKFVFEKSIGEYNFYTFRD